MGTLRAMGTLIVAVGLAAVVPGRASSQDTGPAPVAHHATKSVAPSAVLDVQNNNWLDVHIYMVRDGMLTSLGFMNGPGTAEFDLPSPATVPGADVQLLVLPIGGTMSYLSPTLVISSGDVVDLSIENNLALSSVTISP
jgi:hypothetical protein